jgi:hypothetical protein
MISTLVVSTKAGDLSLLSTEDRRTAVGLDVIDASSDAALAALDLRLASAIAAECNVAIGKGADPTLRKESLTEIFYHVRACKLMLSRRHNVAVTSLVADGETLAADTDFIVDPESAILTKLSSDVPVQWCATKIVVMYDAGFETVPDDLKQAAMDFMRLAWAEKDRDPSLKSEVIDIPDVRRVERGYWVGSVPVSRRKPQFRTSSPASSRAIAMWWSDDAGRADRRS